MSFLDLENKNILVMGVANRKSVAYAVGKSLREEGANVIYSVRSPQRRDSVAKLLGDAPGMEKADLEASRRSDLFLSFP